MTRAILLLPLTLLSLACTEIIEVSIYNEGCCDQGCEQTEEEEDTYCEELWLEVEECWVNEGHPELCEDLERLYFLECEDGGQDCEDRNGDGICDDECPDPEGDCWDEDPDDCEDRDADGDCDNDQDCDYVDEAGECHDDECRALEEMLGECLAEGLPEQCEDIMMMLEEICWS